MATAIQATNPQTRRRGRQGVRYTPAQREQFVEHANQRRAEGVSLQNAAKELAVSYESLRRWGIEQSSTARLRPVRATPAVREIGSLRLITAAGHRIEGLDHEQLVALVRALG